MVGRSLSVQKQTALVATAERHEGNRLETSGGGGGGGGHEEIASLPSNDVTTNANLITGPDIANRSGPVAVVVVWGGEGVIQYRGSATRFDNLQANRGARGTRAMKSSISGN